MKRASRAWASTLVAVVLSCSDEKRDESRSGAPTPQDQRADLGGEAIARVSAKDVSDVVPKSLVAKVAAEQKVAPGDAARRLVDDAVAAVAARERGLDSRTPTSWNLRAARARMVVEHLRGDVRSAGPPTDEEVKELTARHWREVDRPPSARVVHVVVRKSEPEKPNPELDARAKAIAPALRAALVDATSTEDFIAKAKAFPHAKDIDVHVDDPLPPITEEGFSIVDSGSYDLAFSKAANALAQPGDTSPIVETRFGWHVIRLIEKVAEQRMPPEERRIAFTEAAYSLRAQKALVAILRPRREANKVTIEPAAEQLMRSVMANETSGTPGPSGEK